MEHRIVTFGEVLLRLTPPGYLKLSQTNMFAATFGGRRNQLRRITRPLRPEE